MHRVSVVGHLAVRALRTAVGERFVDALRAHLPDGEMPDAEARHELVARWDDEGTLEALDDEYRDALPAELPSRVQA